MKNCQDEISAQLQSSLSKLHEVECKETDLVKRLKKCIQVCHEMLNSWRQAINLYGFPDQRSEIYFFKHGKPRLAAHYRYYQRVLHFHLDEWKGCQYNQEQRLVKEMAYVEQVFEQNRSLWQYYQSRDTSMDSVYFVRGTELWLLNNGTGYFDDSFSSRCDGPLAELLAMEMYSAYIGRRLAGDEDHIVAGPSAPTIGRVVGTGTLTQLTVIGYALYESNIYDRAVLSREMAMEHWGKHWNVDLRNHRQIIYRLKGQHEPDRVLKDMCGDFNNFLGA
ncbi:RteC domain-containing protein [Paraflavitalea pollutisoli]|uniref:RteC domain-containing protein n=1 Tax=Paraflavitalea pollutisoli TaxID=3034143 RepID=UPI0023EC6722|nr:RteC domain-containing protein [Paraflavitalea sp. H1-2-19X]